MEFPNLGEHCSEPTCNRLDFLPLKCDACSSIFCTDHISYKGHSCPSAYQKDVQVPVCPLCNAPVPSKRGDPPDLAVSLHMDNECQSESRKVFSNKCSQKGCRVKEIVSVCCSECTLNFCLRHRHPADHNCDGSVEAVRRRRLDALANGCKGSTKRDSEVFKVGVEHRIGIYTYRAYLALYPHYGRLQSVQGGMSEDEALARALQASLGEDGGRDNRRALQTVPSGYRDRCRLS